MAPISLVLKPIAKQAVPFLFDALCEVARDIVDDTENELDDKIVEILCNMKDIFVEKILEKI